jgi:hypothetical protein
MAGGVLIVWRSANALEDNMRWMGRRQPAAFGNGQRIAATK